MQHYFVFLSFEVLASANYDRDFIHGELEELGLYAQIRLGDVLQPLPEGISNGISSLIHLVSEPVFSQ